MTAAEQGPGALEHHRAPQVRRHRWDMRNVFRRDTGVRTPGVVFDRATAEDFTSSYGWRSRPSVPERVRERREARPVQAFGPVATAVRGKQKALKDA
jgi:hypothetical protein